MEPKIILYIVLGIGYMIFNWYKKLNVPKQNNTNQPSSPQQSNSPDENPEDVFKRLMGEIQGESSKHYKEEFEEVEDFKPLGQSKETTSYNANEIKMDSRFSYENAFNYDYAFGNYQKTVKEEKTVLPIIKQELTKKKIKFDLKQAIINEAILNRPYF